MKRIFFIACLLSTGMAFAQNDAVTNAFFYNKDGELDKAKDEIDKASVHEKTKDKAKTWYFRGLIYENILNSKNPKFQSLAPDAGKQCYESYSKAMALSQKGDDNYDNSAKQIGQLWGVFLNAGVKQYEAKDFAGSIASYELAQMVKPEDTTAYLYALYSAEALKDYPKCKSYTRKLISMGKVNSDMYRSMARQARNAELKDSALAHIQEGRRRYPNDKNLRLEELDLMFQLNRGNEAKSKLEEAVQADSSNASLFAILGNMYDQEAADPKRAAKDQEASKAKALSYYRKALKVDPNNMESNFNLGVFFFNKGAGILKKVNDLDINAYQKVGKKLEADAVKEFKESIPYFETCYKINPKDESVIKSLKNAYERVGRSADAEKLGQP